jgi:UDP-glucuronate decarboxylase
MRVLLTGASGFIGRQCYRILKERGHEVIGLCHENSIDKNMISCDLLGFVEVPHHLKDFISKYECDTLLHLAWYIGPNYRNSSKNLDWLAASLKLVNTFYECGGTRVMTIGSCFEDTVGPIGPKMNYPHTLYGLSKLSLYELLERSATINQLNYIHARLFYLFGPNESPYRLVPATIRALLNNIKIEHDNGEQFRDFLYVEDVADAIVTTLEFPSVTGLLNVGSGQQRTIKEVLNFISIYLNKIDMIKYNLETKETNPYIVANTERLNKIVGWYPKYTFEMGLAKTIEWIKENNKEK